MLAAAEKGNERVSEQLIENGADVNFTTAYGATPLYYASASGNFHLNAHFFLFAKQKTFDELN